MPLVGRPLLLATRLAMSYPLPLPRHRMLADVWPDDTGSDGAVRVALTRLRAALGGDAVCRENGGYTLASPAQVDADRFQRLVRASGDPAEPRQRLAAVEAALAMWHGTPFDGLEQLPWVEAETIRLEELRDHAIDERFGLLLREIGRAHV